MPYLFQLSLSRYSGAIGELTVEDLIKVLGSEERRKLAPVSRKLLEKLSTKPRSSSGGGTLSSTKKSSSAAASSGMATAPLAAPLPRLIKERQERKAGYEETKEEVTKWQPMVKVRG